MVTQAPKRSSVAIALAFVLSCVGLIIFVWTQFGGSIPFAPQGYRIKAVFNETGLLVPHADVRISGVNVGRVTAVQAEGTHSLVTMEISDQYAPVPRNTQAILREKTLLGEAFVQLSTGSGAKLPDGGTIPNAQVHPTEQLDQVLNSFTPPVQHDLQQLLIGTGAALNGDGQDLNDAFGDLDPAATELAAMVSILNSQSANVRALINNSTTVLGTLGDRGAQIDELIGAGNQVTAATASENRALTGTVDALPQFVRQLNTTLGDVGTTLTIAKPSLDALEPVAPLVLPALRGLVSDTGPLVALLRVAPGVLRQARVTLPDISAFLRQLQPAVNALLPASEQVIPMVNIITALKTNIVNSMVNLAATTNGTAPSSSGSGIVPDVGSGMAKYVRALITLGPDSDYGQTSRNAAVRNNSYFAPGELTRIGNGGMRASSCTGAGSGNVPCELAPAYPWGNGIGTSYFPRVTKANP